MILLLSDRSDYLFQPIICILFICAGNIRVYCRVRPFRPWENQKQTIVQNIGEHGEIIVANPAKPKDAPKSFRFNKVYGSMVTQGFFFLFLPQGSIKSFWPINILP